MDKGHGKCPSGRESKEKEKYHAEHGAQSQRSSSQLSLNESPCLSQSEHQARLCWAGNSEIQTWAEQGLLGGRVQRKDHCTWCKALSQVWDLEKITTVVSKPKIKSSTSSIFKDTSCFSATVCSLVKDNSCYVPLCIPGLTEVWSAPSPVTAVCSFQWQGSLPGGWNKTLQTAGQRHSDQGAASTYSSSHCL